MTTLWRTVDKCLNRSVESSSGSEDKQAANAALTAFRKGGVYSWSNIEFFKQLVVFDAELRKLPVLLLQEFEPKHLELVLTG